MPSDELRADIHKDLLELLKVFHKLCVENDIHYSLHGGTLLGAVREKGFIPWDDDVDLTLSRSEFEKFLKVVKNLPENGEIQYQDGPYVRKFEMKREGHELVWLDIFIYDYISEKKLVQKLKIVLFALVSAIYRNDEHMKITKAHGVYTGWKFRLIRFINLLGKIIPQSKKTEWAYKLEQSFGGKKQFVHRSNDQFCGVKLILPASILDEYTTLPFETEEFMVLKKYHEVLVSTYDENYMVPVKFENDEESHRLSRIKMDSDF